MVVGRELGLVPPVPRRPTPLQPRLSTVAALS
jgi:hypothetical protein